MQASQRNTDPSTSSSLDCVPSSFQLKRAGSRNQNDDPSFSVVNLKMKTTVVTSTLNLHYLLFLIESCSTRLRQNTVLFEFCLSSILLSYEHTWDERSVFCSPWLVWLTCSWFRHVFFMFLFSVDWKLERLNLSVCVWLPPVRVLATFKDNINEQ